MPKITRTNIAAARAQRDILIRRGREVPTKIARIAQLDPEKIPAEEPDEAPKQTYGGRAEILATGLSGKVVEGLSSVATTGSGTWQLVRDNDVFVVVNKDNAGIAEEFIHGARGSHPEVPIPRSQADEPRL